MVVSDTRRPVGRPARRPRFGVFIVSGIVLALVVAAVLTLTLARPQGRDGVDYGLGGVFGYLAAVLGLAGALLGGLVAVVLSSLADRRARRAAPRGGHRP